MCEYVKESFFGMMSEHICCLSLLRFVDTRGSYKPWAAITWLYCLLCRIFVGRYFFCLPACKFPVSYKSKTLHWFFISILAFPSLLSAVLHVFTQLIVSRLGWRSSFLLQWFLTQGAVPYFLIHLFIYFQKEKCWSERNIDRSWARRGLWLWHLKVIFLPTAASPPPWLGWVLKIAHWGQYPNPTVTMSAIKNSWLCNVKHGKGQWDNTGHGCEWSAGHHLWSWYIKKYLSL